MHLLSAMAMSFVIAGTLMTAIIRFGPRWKDALVARLEKERRNAKPRAPVFVQETDELRPEDDPYWDLRQQVARMEEQERSGR